ncbi:MAG TPA: 23S rRNA (adenine(2030)-N(6))-methyltransferase RlmJ [Gammaproteobacteria bacterium]|nr:23S rRNA (adenine(2030)-N(6))-methyltransferase RlmJ [Gammaproteobacteria bacterium]
MNYRHTYHAGNIGDVLKHIVLIALIQSLKRKETPFCYLETHAGIGSYDLLADTTQKSREFENGIQKIFNTEHSPDLIQDYITCVKSLNQANTLRYYPGSPYFVKQLLRSEDRMILSELHPEDFQTLKKFFIREKQIAVHHQDGYQSLKAYLPPKERRGLVLIDPAYEKPNELMQLPKLLAEALKRWETGIFALWYPIKTQEQLKPFYCELTEYIHRPFLRVELCVHSDEIALELNGCGMIIMNPPWQLDEKLEEILPFLWNMLNINKQGYNKITSLNSNSEAV